MKNETVAAIIDRTVSRAEFDAALGHISRMEKRINIQAGAISLGGPIALLLGAGIARALGW